ncbi:hypothetical protein RL73_06000 [Liberibacter crescens]|nr:hypothetical protein RL73_06000 [Liberibacter crescens]
MVKNLLALFVLLMKRRLTSNCLQKIFQDSQLGTLKGIHSTLDGEYFFSFKRLTKDRISKKINVRLLNSIKAMIKI